MRDAAHRRTFFQTAISGSKGQLEYSRHEDSIIEEHLVKVAETEHEDRIACCFFHIEVLAHHR